MTKGSLPPHKLQEKCKISVHVLGMRNSRKWSVSKIIDNFGKFSSNLFYLYNSIIFSHT